MRSFKIEGLVKALTSHGVIAQEVRPLWSVPPKSRRRITLAAIGTRDGTIVGFHAQHSKDIVPIDRCLVARPELVALIPDLKSALNSTLNPRENINIHLLLTPNGIDVTLAGPVLNTPEIATRIFNALRPLPYARLTVGEALQHEKSAPILTFGGLHVPPPPAAFLQACAESEALMQALVKEVIGKKAKHVADVFAGIGTFTGVLAEKMRVSAYENHAPAVKALSQALNHATGLKPCSVEDRDLFRRPLVKHELGVFDAVVLNPPRQGAEAQIQWLGKSTVPRIAYVSCNPATFARDAAVLCKAGYSLKWLQPIDQFLWSEHLEVVGCFQK